MNQTILFSPVGGTDPISAVNCRDGSLLHICRVYQPDKVYLYMSQEMLAYQQQDDRYRYCLSKLEALQNRKMQIEEIERGNLKTVQEFDFFYDDFKELLQDICRRMDETDTLLVNVSSGTPAMKSGLLVLAVLGELPVKLIQVSTPEKRINEHIHRDYDVETLWELNDDNRPDFENRCTEVICPSLSKLKDEEMLKKHICHYNYPAALELAKRIPGSERYYPLIEMALAREMLDLPRAEKIMREERVDFVPVKASDIKVCFEYAINMDLKRKKKEYADFIRAISPLLVELFELILKKECRITVEDYCRYQNGLRKWSESKITGTAVEEALLKEFPTFKYNDIAFVHLLALVKHFSHSEDLIRTAAALRDVESKVRNLAAHDIVAVTEERIRELVNMESQDIMNLIRRAFKYTRFGFKEEDWNSYEEMNDFIIAEIG